ncbi:MAG: agmatinase [Clostridiales bacterium]|jgi:agmatinase|nr:agmatinase [Clostridiales bacterium]
MALNKSGNVQNFIGCDASYEDAKVVIFGAPFDSTTSNKPGARFGPYAVRAESHGLETYSPYQDLDLEEAQIYDAGEPELPFGRPQPALDMIEAAVAQILADDKIPLMIGGEHLVTLGAIRAAVKKYPDLRIIHLDAHTDLRDEFLGESLSHATVMRRCHDILGDGRIFQFGIRSGTREEFKWAEKGHTHLQKFNLDGLAEAVAALGDAPVYFTLDLDVLDPAEFPGTGTPEAGGIHFKDLLEAIACLKRLNIVGCDVVELAPNLDTSGISTAMACKVIRELLLAIGRF